MDPIQATPPAAAVPPTSDPYTSFYSSQQFAASEDNFSRSALSSNGSNSQGQEQMKETINENDPDGTPYVVI